MTNQFNKEDFFRFSQRILEKSFIQTLAESVGAPTDHWVMDDLQKQISKILEQAIHDAAYTLSFLPAAPASAKLLEVGSGTGILGAYLHAHGHEIYLLEPALIGFELHARIFEGVTRLFNIPRKYLLICKLEDLHGHALPEFDLIFSNNVLEHVDDPAACLSLLHSQLAAGGTMVHNCPNYTVPYEPHFGIPLIPWLPRLTRYLLPKSIHTTGVWHSLNFITANTVSNAARKSGAEVVFSKGIFLDALTRLFDDPAYALRHPYALWCTRILQKAGALRLFGHLPAELGTPMIFTWKRTAQ